MKSQLMMKAFFVVVLAVLLMPAGSVQAAFLSADGVTATSYYDNGAGFTMPPERLINGEGLDVISATGLHIADSSGAGMTHAAAGEGVVDLNWTFHFDGSVTLSNIYIWQFNQYINDSTLARQVETFNLYVSTDNGATFTLANASPLTLGPVPGTTEIGAETFALEATGVTDVRLDPLTARNGGDSYVGLSEVHFEGISETKVTNPTPADSPVPIDKDGVTGLTWDNPIAYTAEKFVLEFRAGTEETEPNWIATTTITVDPVTDTDSDPDTTTAAVPATLDYSTTYYWRVTAYDPNGTPGVPGNDIPYVGPAWSFATIAAEPVFTTQPESVLCGAAVGVPDAVFEVVATNATSYQWYKDGSELIGETGTTLTITGAVLTDDGEYTCVASNDTHDTTSAVAVLEIAREKLHLDFEGDVSDNYGYATTWQGDNSAAFVTEGYLGQALDIDAVGDPNSGIVVDANALPASGLGVTLSFWTKHEGDLKSVTVCEALNSIGELRSLGVHVPWENEAIYFDAGDTNSSDRLTDSSIDYVEELQGTWNHWVFTKDVAAGTMKSYYNGVLAISTTNDTKVIDSGDSFLVGTDHDKNALNGLLDDFRLYNYAISDEDVATLYYDATNNPTCLYPPVLDIANGDTGLVQGDEGFVGDCKVDLYDFAALAEEWLDCGLIPTAACN